MKKVLIIPAPNFIPKIPSSKRPNWQTKIINGKGQPVPEVDQEFVWIGDPFDDKVKTLEVIHPFKTDTINDVLLALKETLHTNFMASLTAVGEFDKWILIRSALQLRIET